MGTESGEVSYFENSNGAGRGWYKLSLKVKEIIPVDHLFFLLLLVFLLMEIRTSLRKERGKNHTEVCFSDNR